jgi:hypothetical protein
MEELRGQLNGMLILRISRRDGGLLEGRDG